jgi:1,4-dihydroxy-6-naphthoate synthase
MKISLGFSPCPNDTFIFDAMVHGKVDTEGLTFDYFLSDVEELNRKAFAGEVDVTKISCHAYAYIADDYKILDAGGALVYGSGPLLIGKRYIDEPDLKDSRIAIPGKYTTANLLFSIAWPEAQNKTEYLFSTIEDILLKDMADAGLIIHETRFTYQKKGLVKIADMGDFWSNLTGLPIPLGSIIIKRTIPVDVALKVNRVLRRSIEHARNDSTSPFDFVRSNAKEMDSSVINSHIKMFVNSFSIDLGKTGREALIELFRIAHEKGVTPAVPYDIFLT